MMKPPRRMGGESVLRAVGRAVSGQDVVTKSTKKRATERSDDGTFHVRPPQTESSSPTFAGAVGGSSAAVAALCTDWQAVSLEETEKMERESELEDKERTIFGSSPTQEEAESVISAIQLIPLNGFIHQATEDEDSSYIDDNDTAQNESGESDWIEPSLHAYSSIVSSKERQKVLEAFRLLQINPSIQKMVVSLSSDKAVWDAVMKNEIVQEFKKTFQEASQPHNSDDKEEPGGPAGVVKWIFGSTKAKVIEFMERISKIVSEIFDFNHPKQEGERSDFFADAVRSSLMLSVVVFLIVMVTRVQNN